MVGVFRRPLGPLCKWVALIWFSWVGVSRLGSGALVTLWWLLASGSLQLDLGIIRMASWLVHLGRWLVRFLVGWLGLLACWLLDWLACLAGLLAGWLLWFTGWLFA